MHTTMGSSPSKSIVSKPYMIIERMIDADCDIFRHVDPRFRNLRIGICNMSNPNNPFGSQCISVPGEDLKMLQGFEQGSNSLRYTFEGGTVLTIMKRENDEVCYHLKTPTHEGTRAISDILQKMYKPIQTGTPCELDKVQSLFT